MKRVLIVQRMLPHYRVPFFEQLRERLASEEIALELVVGQPTKGGAAKRDEARLSWATTVNNRYLRSGPGRHLVWQPVWRRAQEADLVVVEQASRLIVNYLLLAKRRFGGPKVAFWGHGVNLDRKSASRMGEAVKRKMAPLADWWFCYTDGTARRLEAVGVRSDRMTVVQNAIDVQELRKMAVEVSDGDKKSLRASLGIGEGVVALSLGSIYPGKRPDYLVEVGDQIRNAIPDFHLVVIGDGPNRSTIDVAAITRPWLHPVGMLSGEPMVAHASLASLLLNPGVVGLAVVDGFALGLPTVTCDLELHGPEIEYLVDGVNGVILERNTSPAEFAASVARLLSDADLLARLQSGCHQSAAELSIEAMVDHFASGLHDALSADR